MADGRSRSPGRVPGQAAIAALHADARTAEETDWVQIVAWYDHRVHRTNSPVARLNRAITACLHERDGDPVIAARLDAEAARAAPSLPERDHPTRQAARLNAQRRS